uniref:Chromo domain-containing protein n=1 Tax=Romanomermis culicivorax TaxID=13658 RepID=A0A915IL74_ROMCU
MKTEAPLDEEELYEVEAIVDMRTMKNGKIQYRVRWANYSPSNDTWEPEENLESCADFIENFLASKKTVLNRIDKDDLTTATGDAVYQRVKRKRTEYLDESALSSSASDNDKNGKDDDKLADDQPSNSINEKCVVENLPLTNIFEMTGPSFQENNENDENNEKTVSKSDENLYDNVSNSVTVVDKVQNDSVDQELHLLDNLLANVSVFSAKKRNSKSSKTSVNVDLIDLVIDSVIRRVLHGDLSDGDTGLPEENANSSVNGMEIDHNQVTPNHYILKTITTPNTIAGVPTVKQEMTECLTVLTTSLKSVGRVESVIQESYQTSQNDEKAADGPVRVDASSEDLRVDDHNEISKDPVKENSNNLSKDHSKIALTDDSLRKIETESSTMTDETNNQRSISPGIPLIVNDKNLEAADVEVGMSLGERNQTPPPIDSFQKQQQQTPPRVLKPLFSGLWLPLTKAKNQNVVVAAVDEQPPTETKILSLERINDDNNKESSESPQLPSIPEEDAPALSAAPTVELSNLSVAVASTSKKSTSLEDMLDRKLNLNDYFKSLMHKSQNFDRTKTHIVTQTDLFESCRLGHFDLVRSALLAAKNSKSVSAYNLNALDEYGRTVLMNLVLTKCDSCHIIDDIMELLVQNGANLNLRSREGDTALMMAIQSEYLCKVTKLLSLGAAANLPNHAGETPLLMACSKSLNLFVTKLLESGADFNAVGASGTPLSSLIFNKTINKLIQTHEKRVKLAFDQTLQSILDLDKLQIRLPLFPLHCYSLNESRVFRIIFPHQKLPAVMRSNRDHEILVIGLSKFGTQSICVRLWGLSPVVNVLLNGQEQKCVQDDWRFIYKLNCLKNGTNELTIKCADDFRMSKCKLLIQAFVLQRR